MSESIADMAARHARGGAIAATLTATYAKIAEHADPALFIALRPLEDALAIAARLEAEGPAGKPLYGVPFAVKDNIDVAGLPTTAACPAFEYLPAASSFVVARLEAAGAIVVGKTNLDQFATGLVGVRSPYGVPRNALRPELIPGGSSAGSGTSVGAGLVPFSLGTDTAGSGRIPAAMNGIVGLKPSLGALSATGVVPACKSVETISIFALDVADAFATFEVAAGYDAADPYSKPLPAPKFAAPPPNITTPAGRIELAVVGAHLSGLPLNGELKALGATFVREAKTTADYRLFALPNTTPPKPGLLRVAAGEGASIAVEIWALDAAGFGAFVAAIPAPLGIGALAFADGSSAKGFLVEAEAVKGALDVSAHGGWRAYLAAR